MSDTGDEVTVDELRETIRKTHGLDATWIESVHVVERFQDAIVWAGDVQVFAVEHPKATRCYAWSHLTKGTKRRFLAVLGAPPVTDAQMAVRVAILAEASGRAN